MFPRVTHPSATKPEGFVRLACVRRAASVRSEPGSNSHVDSNPRSKSMNQSPITTRSHSYQRITYLSETRTSVQNPAKARIKTTVRISLPYHNVNEQKRPDRKSQSVKQMICFGQAVRRTGHFVSVRQGDLYMVADAIMSRGDLHHHRHRAVCLFFQALPAFAFIAVGAAPRR